MEALEAIKEIQLALSQYGSDITFRSVTKGTYDPLTGDTTDTIVDIPTKAFIQSQASEATQRAFNGDYEVSFFTYLSSKPDKDDKIIYQSETYNIVYIAPTTLQNLNIKYEILGKK